MVLVEPGSVPMNRVLWNSIYFHRCKYLFRQYIGKVLVPNPFPVPYLNGDPVAVIHCKILICTDNIIHIYNIALITPKESWLGQFCLYFIQLFAYGVFHTIVADNPQIHPLALNVQDIIIGNPPAGTPIYHQQALFYFGVPAFHKTVQDKINLVSCNRF